MLSSNNSSPSYAGSWGIEKRAMLRGGKSVADHEAFMTTSRSSFNVQIFSTEKNEADNKFAKFHALRMSGAAIMDSQKSKDWSNGEAGDRNETVSTNNSNLLNSNEQLGATISSTGSWSGFNYSPSRSPSKLSLHKTMSKLLTLPDAPVAKGRSGTRQEKGLSKADALCGERLMINPVEPQKDSEAQRSWLYAEDPALQIRVGKRRVESIDTESLGVSLQVGEELQNNGINPITAKGWDHGRKAILTGIGDLSSKTGRMTAGIFQDG